MKEKKWKRLLVVRIMQEKEYTEECARWIVDRVEGLVDYMQYGHALLAYKRQDGEFRLAKGTLLCHERAFGKVYSPEQMKGGILVYWDVEAQGWRNLLVENFLEWRPVL